MSSNNSVKGRPNCFTYPLRQIVSRIQISTLHNNIDILCRLFYQFYFLKGTKVVCPMVVPVRGISHQIPNYRESMSSQELSPSPRHSFGSSGFTWYISESEQIESEISKRKMLIAVHVCLTIESSLIEEKYLS